MARAAILGALLIGEYGAGALVVFMLRFGELLEDFTVARADNALKPLDSAHVPFDARQPVDNRSLVLVNTSMLFNSG